MEPADTTQGKPHSAEQFGEQRDFWWSRDYLTLLRERIAFAEARTLLDVGCGKCHWTAIAAGFFPKLEAIVGVDFEATWVEGASEALRARLGGNDAGWEASFLRADAQALPFADATFDVATCQTVLMHLALPEQGLRELFRVVRPGGLVLVAEPANSPNLVPLDSAALALPLDDLVARYRFWTAAHLGRKASGRGDWDVGNRLLELFGEMGASEVHVHQNDRVNGVAPPYELPHQQALLAFGRDWEAQLLSPEGRTELAGLARAGGLVEADIALGLAIEERLCAIRRRQIAEHTFVDGGGAVHYVAWGRRS